MAAGAALRFPLFPADPFSEALSSGPFEPCVRNSESVGTLEAAGCAEMSGPAGISLAGAAGARTGLGWSAAMGGAEATGDGAGGRAIGGGVICVAAGVAVFK